MYAEEERAFVGGCIAALSTWDASATENTCLVQYAITSAAVVRGFPLTMGFGTCGRETPILRACPAASDTATDKGCSPADEKACVAFAEAYAELYETDPYFFVEDYPQPYRAIYERHIFFSEALRTYGARCHTEGYEPGARPLERLLLDYGGHLGHLPHHAHDVVLAYLDVVDNIVLKEGILCAECPPCRHQLWDAVMLAYDGMPSGETVWSLVAPYLLSLEGMSAPYEAVRGCEHYEVLVSHMHQRVQALERLACSMGIYPTREELEEELCESCRCLSEEDVRRMREAVEDDP